MLKFINIKYVEFIEFIKNFGHWIALVGCIITGGSIYSNRHLENSNRQLKNKIEGLQSNFHNIPIGRTALIERWINNPREAKTSIIALSYSVGGKPTQNDEEKGWEEYLKILKRKCNNKEFKAKILAPSSDYLLIRLCQRQIAGAEVRVSNRVNKFRFRFQICDGVKMILNLPLPEINDTSSSVGYEIREKLFVNYCCEIFEKEWGESEDLNSYIENRIIELLPTLNNGMDGKPIEELISIIINSTQKGLEEEYGPYWADEIKEYLIKQIDKLEEEKHVKNINGYYHKA